MSLLTRVVYIGSTFTGLVYLHDTCAPFSDDPAYCDAYRLFAQYHRISTQTSPDYFSSNASSAVLRPHKGHLQGIGDAKHVQGQAAHGEDSLAELAARLRDSQSFTDYIVSQRASIVGISLTRVVIPYVWSLSWSLSLCLLVVYLY